jgi:histidinol-phosphate aminotransferase
VQKGLKRTHVRWRCGLSSSDLKPGLEAPPEIAPKQPVGLRPRQAVLDMAAYHPPTGGRRNKLRLDFNENTVGAPPHVVDFIKRYLTASDLSIYPEYEHALEDLSQHFGVLPDELTLTNGTDEAIQVLVNTYVDPGNRVLILQPSYAMYRFYSQLAGAEIEDLSYRPGTLAFPLEELLEKITPELRAIFISNPNNPTGTGIGVNAISRILRKAPNAAVLIDEAYYEFSGVTAIPLLEQHANLFVSRTFSKTYGMAAMRCGCLFSRAENMELIRKAQSPYSVNAVAAMAARIAIQDKKFVEDYVLEVLTARELLYVGLERLHIPYVKSQANFVLFQAGDKAIPLRDALRERGILVRDRSYELPGYVRVTVGTRDQIHHFLTELEKLW